MIKYGPIVWTYSNSTCKLAWPPHVCWPHSFKIYLTRNSTNNECPAHFTNHGSCISYKTRSLQILKNVHVLLAFVHKMQCFCMFQSRSFISGFIFHITINTNLFWALLSLLITVFTDLLVCLNFICKCIVSIISTFLFKFAMCSSWSWSSFFGPTRVIRLKAMFCSLLLLQLVSAGFSDRLRLGCLTSNDWMVADGMTGVPFHRRSALLYMCWEVY